MPATNLIGPGLSARRAVGRVPLGCTLMVITFKDMLLFYTASQCLSIP